MTAAQGLHPKLQYLGVEITRRCNLHCPHCFTASGEHSHLGPSTEQAKRLMEATAIAGIPSVAFSGGEPLLREDLEEIMRHGRDHGLLRYSMVTNGRFVTRARIRALREVGLTSAMVSVDGVDARDHAMVRNCSQAEYYRALRAIRVLLEEGIELSVACILSVSNLERAPEMVLLCEAMNVKELRFCTFIPMGRGRALDAFAALRPGRAEVERFLEFATRVNENPAIPVRISTDHGVGPWGTKAGIVCQAGRDAAYVSAEGDLYPCPGLLASEFLVGNVHQVPLVELLRAPRMTFVHTIDKRDIAGSCAVCHNDGCGGGCRGAALALHGDILGPVLYCIKGPVPPNDT